MSCATSSSRTSAARATPLVVAAPASEGAMKSWGTSADTGVVMRNSCRPFGETVVLVVLVALGGVVMVVAPPLLRGEKPEGEVGGVAALCPGRDGDGGVDGGSWWERRGEPNSGVLAPGPAERGGSLSVGEEL